MKPSSLPCGGCDYCTRADRNWDSFARVVNCTITMASQGLHRIIASTDGGTKGNATGECKIGTQKKTDSKTGDDDALLKKHSLSNLGIEALVPESSTGVNLSFRSKTWKE